MRMTPEERSERARHAAQARWARKDQDPDANAKRGQAGLLARFAREADPRGELPEAERLELARQRQSAHMAELSRLAWKARRAAAGSDQE